jgi:hypothetical protein
VDKTAPKAKAPKELTETLDAFIKRHETKAQSAGLVVTAISYPGAVARPHEGVYAGFPVTPGDLSATYSDGSKH